MVKKVKLSFVILIVLAISFCISIISVSAGPTPITTTSLAITQTINVPSDYSTITAAVNNANNGDTVIVAPGTYNENQIVINKSIKLIGAGAQTVIDGGDAILTEPGLIRIISSGNVFVSGFTIKNAGGPSVSDSSDNKKNIGIYLETNASPTYTLNNLYVIGRGISSDNEDFGVYLLHGKENLIFRNGSIKNTKKGFYSAASALSTSSTTTTNVNFNSLTNNFLDISNENSLPINATNNFWGDCNGPSASDTTGNVNLSPWLGVCVTDLATSSSCVVATDSVDLFSNVNSNSCIGKVNFLVNSDGTWKSYNGTRTIDNKYTVKINGLIEHSNVEFKVSADDCYNHLTESAAASFYVNSATKLLISPSSPDGKGKWYTSRPIFTLDNPDAAQIFYRWDSSSNILYTVKFSLENTPNSGNLSGGIFQLNYYSNVCNEKTQKAIFYIDLSDPIIKDIYPVDGSQVVNSEPNISASLVEQWNGESGINKSSIIMTVDSVSVNPVVTGSRYNSNTFVSYIPTVPLSKGIHTATIYTEDNSGRSSTKTFKFKVISAPELNITLVSPIDKVYGSKRIQINLTTDSNVSKIDFIDYNARPVWKTMCTDCDNIGAYKSISYSFKDGINNISFRATDYYGTTREQNIVFRIDTEKPTISDVYPSRGTYTNGSLFFVKYSESNLKDITLYINSTIKDYVIHLTDCSSGKNKICSTDALLSENTGNEIEYYYALTDIADNLVMSKKTKVKVDSVSPVLTLFSPAQNLTSAKNVVFNITVSENVKLEYIDNSNKHPKFTKICSNCNGFGNKKVQSLLFTKGSHDVLIRATDNAGNSDTKEVLFSVK